MNIDYDEIMRRIEAIAPRLAENRRTGGWRYARQSECLGKDRAWLNDRRFSVAFTSGVAPASVPVLFL